MPYSLSHLLTLLTQPMHNWYTSLIKEKAPLSISFFLWLLLRFIYLLQRISQANLKDFYGKLYLKFKTGLNRHTTILILLTLFLWYVNICEYITTYNR